MKSIFQSKLCVSIVTLMLFTVMMPALASAALYFHSYSFKNSTVTAEVYGGESLNVTGDVYLHIYDADRNLIRTVTVSSDTYDVDEGFIFYDFHAEDVSGSVYGAVYLEAEYTIGDDTFVTDAVYAEHEVIRNRGGGGGGGSNGIANINESRLQAQFVNGGVAVFTITGTAASLPASALIEAPEGAIVIIKNSTGSYSLPVDALDFDALAEQLGVEAKDMKIVVSIAELKGDDTAEFDAALKEIGGTAASKAVDFTVEAKAGTKTVAVTDLGDTFAERTINGASLDSGVTGVVFDPETGEFRFVPLASVNGVATLKSTTNSIYAVVSFDYSFADIAGHWSQPYVESLANKLIVEGYEDGAFGPNRSITRAEFATLIVRALGLNGKIAPDAPFSDVSTSDWYEGAVALAADAGIVNGYEDGTFRPNQVISREELAAMVVRASAYAGTELSATTNERSALLSNFADANGIVWAHEELAAAVAAGIVTGYEDGTIRASSNSTRAEATTMIQRFLANADFIVE